MRTANLLSTCALFCALLAGCEKAKMFTDEVQAKLAGKAASGLMELGGPEMDPELEALVDKTDEGYLFRRDISFPQEMDIRAEEVIAFDECQVFGRSPYGGVKDRLSLTNRKIRFYKRRSGSIDCTIEVDQIEKALDEKMSEEERASAITKSKDAGAQVSFNYTGGSWTTRKTTDFAKAMANQRHEKELDVRLSEDGLMSRARWFGQKRIKMGSKVQLSVDLLDLVFPRGTEGSATMTLVGIEGVHGHPCGIFEITGNLDFIEPATQESLEADGKTSLESGSKVWLSLLYPVVLRKDLHTVTTLKFGEVKNGGGIISGKMKLTTLLDWQIASNKKAAAPE
ncbi:hypothetical protein ACFSSA_11640 [Luteolibacter algae]|uniref:Lipoprotein n=1 Tax=Luteolibacter algae TaxID=454151 RepID=A0ABW5D927_9BACT